MFNNRTLNGLHTINCDEITSEIFTGITLPDLEQAILNNEINTGTTTTNLQTEINQNLAYQNLYNSGLLTNLGTSFLNDRSFTISNDLFLQNQIDAIVNVSVSASVLDVLYGVSIAVLDNKNFILGVSTNNKLNSNATILPSSFVNSSLTSLGDQTSTLNLSNYPNNGNVWSIQSKGGGNTYKKILFNNTDTILNANSLQFNNSANSVAFGEWNTSALQVYNNCSISGTLQAPIISLIGVSSLNLSSKDTILGISSSVLDLKVMTLNNQVSGINYHQINDELEINNIGITINLHENDIITLYTLGTTFDSRLDTLEYDVNTILLPGITFTEFGVSGSISTTGFLDQVLEISDVVLQIADYIELSKDIYQGFQTAQTLWNTAVATYNGYSVLKDIEQDGEIVVVQAETTSNSTAIGIIQGQIVALDAFVVVQLLNNTSQSSSISTNTSDISALGSSGIVMDYRIFTNRTDLDNYISSNNGIITNYGTTLSNHTTSIFQLGSTMGNYTSRIPMSTAGITFFGQTIPTATMTDAGMVVYNNLSVSGVLQAPIISSLGVSVGNLTTNKLDNFLTTLPSSFVNSSILASPLRRGEYGPTRGVSRRFAPPGRAV